MQEKIIKELKNKIRTEQMQKYNFKLATEKRETNLKQLIFKLAMRLIEISPDDELIKDIEKIKEEFQKCRP